MKKVHSFFAFMLVLILIGMKSTSFAQNGPAMYFCEKYGKDGEKGISDRFTTGYLTVVVKCDYALRLKDVHVQLDKWNKYSNKFEYYKKFDYTLEPDMKYVYFAKNEDSDMSFDDPGFYRVFLLDDDDKTVASAVVEIID